MTSICHGQAQVYDASALWKNILKDSSVLDAKLYVSIIYLSRSSVGARGPEALRQA